MDGVADLGLYAGEQVMTVFTYGEMLAGNLAGAAEGTMSAGVSSTASLLPEYANTAGGLANFAKNLEQGYLNSGSVPSSELLDQIFQQAEELGVDIRVDPAHQAPLGTYPTLMSAIRDFTCHCRQTIHRLVGKMSLAL